MIGLKQKWKNTNPNNKENKVKHNDFKNSDYSFKACKAIIKCQILQAQNP
jgi:hypothetical protein